MHYRNYFLRHVLAKIDERTCASEVCKSINVLVAIRWVAMAWSLIQEETVRKCFRKAGVLESSLTVFARDEQDPFLAADECETLEDLISTTMSGHEACPVEEYLQMVRAVSQSVMVSMTVTGTVFSLHNSVRRRRRQ